MRRGIVESIGYYEIGISERYTINGECFLRMSGIGHWHKVLDRPFDNAATALLCKCLVVQVLGVGREEGNARPDYRKRYEAVAKERRKSGRSVQIRDTRCANHVREKKNDDSDDDKYQAEGRECPISEAGIEGVKYFDQMAGGQFAVVHAFQQSLILKDAGMIRRQG